MTTTFFFLSGWILFLLILVYHLISKIFAQASRDKDRDRDLTLFVEMSKLMSSMYSIYVTNIKDLFVVMEKNLYGSKMMLAEDLEDDEDEDDDEDDYPEPGQL